ncbi:hypothetical protein K0M31_010545 [Melipona bicolor]|uniref:Uncharacterized protein n=1 Tax=Melipona bicolor TaxID=60889 RepID=A0AA40KIC3_9HYME|nr:hypothetical protein K0M31_010545 [Melipona bicolor]
MSRVYASVRVAPNDRIKGRGKGIPLLPTLPLSDDLRPSYYRAKISGNVVSFARPVEKTNQRETKHQNDDEHEEEEEEDEMKKKKKKKEQESGEGLR